jgi:RNA polymerase sigma-70 factor (ECF subfamily)
VTVLENSSDASLAVAAAQGDHAAFATIMRRHKGWLYQFIRRYVADRDDAYDVLQESFVSAWAAMARFDPERPMQAWLRRIALNKCRDRARRNMVRRTALRVLGMAEQSACASEAATPGADTTAATDEARRRLEQAIASLPQQLKEPLILTMLEDMSHKQAGELLGINPKAVETRVYRAKRRLAAMLDRGDLVDIAKSD